MLSGCVLATIGYLVTVLTVSELACTSTRVNRFDDVFKNMVLQRSKGTIELVVVLEVDRLDSRKHCKQVGFECSLLVFVI